MLGATYLLPIRADRPAVDTELAGYLEDLTGRAQVLVIDGSASAVFDEHARVLPGVEHHAPHHAGLNGKVAGVLSGIERAGHEAIVIADDDVRYDASSLERVLALLQDADVVIPQNHFAPAPWHALWDTARTLLNRVTGGDWPGTLAVRRLAIERVGGYDPDVLFENLELVRTLRVAGARVVRADDVYVRRLPPSAARFWSQRVRQAYDELARPRRLAIQLAFAPLLGVMAVAAPALLAVAALASVALAEAGRRRMGGARHFPAAASWFAPVWIAERAITAWLAVATRVFRGGIRYRGRIVRRAATPERELRRRLAMRASVSSRCAARRDGRLTLLRSGRAAPSLASMVHDTLRAQVLSPAFPCVGARSAFRRDSYWFGLYDDLGDDASVPDLASDLASFVRDPVASDGRLSTFVASFRGPELLDEAAFEERLWRTLQLLHERDGEPWEPSVSSDPEDRSFAFSFAGRALFVVGMHAASSRWSRRFAWPTLVFNPHAQFRRLRSLGMFERLRHAVRARDRALQGSVNPMLADFGEASEARQYSGRHGGPDWRCPFRAA